jgi:hypothetical protein
VDYIKSLSIRIYPVAVAIVILAGIGIIVAAGFAASLPIQIALGLGGLVLIFLGIIAIRVIHEERQSQEKLDVLLTKLDELREEMKQEEKQGKSGIAIADVISSSLKFYADYKEKEHPEETDSSAEPGDNTLR